MRPQGVQTCPLHAENGLVFVTGECDVLYSILRLVLTPNTLYQPLLVLSYAQATYDTPIPIPENATLPRGDKPLHTNFDLVGG